MASAVGSVATLSRLTKPLLLPATAVSLAYGGYVWRHQNVDIVRQFFTGAGRNSRIIALLLIIMNWKSMPLAWTVRVFATMINHLLMRDNHTYGPDKLFLPSISQTHVSLLEVDYNIHKSNSTYFADLDVSRSHLVSHLMARGIRALLNNATTRLVLDPADPSRVARGKFGVMLGAVHCSFKREIRPFQRYELWTRILSWDRKWLYMVTHFVEAGTVRPRSWAAGSFGPTRKTATKPEDWEKKVFATAVSKYVYKIGRLTIHPAVIIDASGLLPERPDGWVSAGSSGVATPAEPVVGNTDAAAKAEVEETGWDWKRTEAERLKGWEYAQHFAALDGLSSKFDAGEDGALARWTLG